MEVDTMKIKSPCYLFDKSEFKKAIQEYKTMGEVFYPVKSNDDDLIINTVIEESCCFEADSIEHIKLLINNYHVDSQKILYSYPIREKEDIIESNILGINNYVIDSESEYEKICEVVKEPNFYVRLNAVDILDNNYPAFQNKWGLSIENAKKLIQRIRVQNHKVIGISFYLFSEIVSFDSLKKMLNRIKVEFINYNIKYLNIGGGVFPSEINKLDKVLCDTKKAIGAKNIIIEPGTPLLNSCIDMVVSITAIRNINNHRFIFINSGIYNGLIDVIIKKRHFIIEDTILENKSNKIHTIVCGCSSDVSDCLGEYHLRANLSVGDQLIIKGCGAYSAVMQTNFYRKKPILMMIKDENNNGKLT